jgi:hypothetical protein
MKVRRTRRKFLSSRGRTCVMLKQTRTVGPDSVAVAQTVVLFYIACPGVHASRV